MPRDPEAKKDWYFICSTCSENFPATADGFCDFRLHVARNAGHKPGGLVDADGNEVLPRVRASSYTSLKGVGVLEGDRDWKLWSRQLKDGIDPREAEAKAPPPAVRAERKADASRPAPAAAADDDEIDDDDESDGKGTGKDRESPSGRVRVSVPKRMYLWFEAIVTRLAVDHPEVLEEFPLNVEGFSRFCTFGLGTAMKDHAQEWRIPEILEAEAQEIVKARGVLNALYTKMRHSLDAVKDGKLSPDEGIAAILQVLGEVNDITSEVA